MDDDIKAPLDEFELPPSLKLLRHLVTVLTVVMIIGVVVIIGLLVTRLNDTAVALPDTITLGDGSVPVAFTQTQNWYAVVTSNDEIQIFDLNGKPVQTIQVKRPN
jgi:hypothetical protein